MSSALKVDLTPDEANAIVYATCLALSTEAERTGNMPVSTTPEPSAITGFTFDEAARTLARSFAQAEAVTA